MEAMKAEAMRQTQLRFALSKDNSMVRATIDVEEKEVTVITAMLYGPVDDARKERIGAAMSALAVECLECVPAAEIAPRGDA